VQHGRTGSTAGPAARPDRQHGRTCGPARRVCFRRAHR
jgi:hypothetical protein